MAEDPANGRVLLFGGADANDTSLGGTYEWDGTRWAQLQPSSAPAGYSNSMAEDPAQGGDLLFGGGVGTPGGGPWLVPDDQTWLWAHGTWTELHPAHHPKQGGSMAYDDATGQIMLLSDATVSNATWVWTGSDWNDIQGGPFLTSSGELAYDPQMGNLLMTEGSFTQSSGGPIWAWDGTGWNELAAVLPGHSCEVFATDYLHGDVVCLDDSNVTFLFSGGTWTGPYDTGLPPGLASNSYTYSPIGNCVAVFGGSLDTAPTNSVTSGMYVWTGSEWSAVPS
jgi:hypothetical protein